MERSSAAWTGRDWLIYSAIVAGGGVTASLVLGGRPWVALLILGVLAAASLAQRARDRSPSSRR